MYVELCMYDYDVYYEAGAYKFLYFVLNVLLFSSLFHNVLFCNFMFKNFYLCRCVYNNVNLQISRLFYHQMTAANCGIIHSGHFSAKMFTTLPSVGVG